VAAITYPSRSRKWAMLLGAVLSLAAAFSAAQTPPASNAPAATADNASTEPPAAAAAASVASADQPASEVDVAIVLPLESPQYGRAADAVRTGFLAAAEASPKRPRIRVFAHGDDGVLAAFEAARASGAKIIVGPLVRDDVRTVASLSLDLPMTLVLNQLDDLAGVPPTLYSLALGVEGDGRMIARRMRSDNARAVAVINVDTPLMKRLVGAFATEWLQSGGAVPGVYGFVATPEALRTLRREIVRHPPDAALLALDNAGATQAKPYLGTTRTYASGLVFERATPAVMRDLDGLVIVEIPWLVTPQAAQFANLPRKEFGSVALTRLYALGLDAFRVAQTLREGAPEHLSFEGATGQVTLGEGRQFQREGVFAIFRAGQLAPLDRAR